MATWTLLLACACLAAPARAAEERIWLDARIDGKPARMFFDTGMSEIALFRQRAEKFGLRRLDSPPESISTAPLAPGQVSLRQWTEDCQFYVWDTTFTYSMAALDVPDYLLSQPDAGDGCIGWYPVRKNIFAIDASALKAEPLDELPPEAASWTRLAVSTRNSVLNLETRGRDGRTLVIGVDTGKSTGVSLSPELWKRWRKAHPEAPVTLMAGWMPALGKVAAEEEGWAEELRLGGVELRGVPVQPGNAAAAAHDAVLGLAALKRLRLIVDGKDGTAYVLARQEPPPPYEHNQIGAVFIPPEGPKDGLLAARVIKGSPAYAAGVRDGDALLTVDGKDVSEWSSRPDQLELLDFMGPSGRRLELTLRRGAKTFKAAVVLRRLLGPR